MSSPLLPRRGLRQRKRGTPSLIWLIRTALPQDLCSGCCVSLNPFSRYLLGYLPHIKSLLIYYFLIKVRSTLFNTTRLPNPPYPAFCFSIHLCYNGLCNLLIYYAYCLLSIRNIRSPVHRVVPGMYKCSFIERMNVLSAG